MMKKLLLFTLFAFTAVAGSVQTAEAQTSNYGWNGFYFAYKPSFISWNKHQDDYKEIFPAKHSIAFGFIANPKIGSSNATVRMPLDIQYTFGNFDDEDYKTSIDIVSMNLSIGVGYAFEFGNAAIQPHIGLNGRLNFWGQLKMDYDDKDFIDQKFLLFNKDEPSKYADVDDPIPMGKEAWKRFQIGLNAGIDFKFGSCLIGASYVVDFNKLIDNKEYSGRFSYISLHLGMVF